MEHHTSGALMFFLFFVPLFVLFYIALKQGPKTALQIDAQQEELERIEAWKQPEPILINMPFAQTCQAVIDDLPRCSYVGHAWRIMNVENGIPTTISANLSCLDETDPGNVLRSEVGLLITVNEQNGPGQFSTVKLHFIPYEGTDLSLEKISQGTYDFLQQCLSQTGKSGASARRQADSRPILDEPLLAVPKEITYPASSGAPVPDNSDFFADPAPANNWFPDVVLPEDEPRPSPSPSPSSSQSRVPAQSSAQSPAHSSFSAASAAPAAAALPAPSPAPSPKPASAPPSTPPAAPAPKAAPMPMPAPAVFSVPAAFDLPTTSPTSLPAADLLSAITPAAGAAEGALCPGCSQPINPSFPFCLYCGKNF